MIHTISQDSLSSRIFDVLGKEVETLLDEIEEPGFKSAQFDAAGLANGAYFYRLEAGEYVATKKLVLLR